MKMRLVWSALVLVMVCGCGKKKIADADLYNVQAGLDTPAAKDQPAGTSGGGLPYPVLEWKAITSVVDRGTETTRAGTTSTLFGNDAAVSAARAGVAYPAGAVLGLVTWKEREDPHWFGARIPGEAVSVEFVEVGGTDRMFVGRPWREVAGTAKGEILGMKAAVAP